MNERPVRVNVGCGRTPTPGWSNCDNSPSLRLAQRPALAWLVGKLGLLTVAQREFVSFAARNDLIWANAGKRLPFAGSSVDAVYSSHMVEHLTRPQARVFLAECHRVLKPGGVIRVAVPDLKRLVARYLETGDADRFLEDTRLVYGEQQSIALRLRFLVIGNRDHNWMYDAASLMTLLTSAGFHSAAEQTPGSTRIPDPGALDLAERADESVYVEALR